MASPQAQANTPQQPMAPEKGKEKKQKQRREPSRLTVWWRFFWNQRSGARMVWALILTIPALLAAIYLALPQSDQAQVVAAIQAAGQTLGATGLRVGMEVTLVVFALASLALLLAPGYRKYRYLHLPTSVIPPITVYVDAENLNSKQIMDAMTNHLRFEFLQGSRAKMRADLLFFMDAADTRSRYIEQPGKHVAIPKWNYEALYKNGFRLINSPHVFTGKAEMAEVVDREIAMHALERALVGGVKQEFVIVSGDGDYAPLIYRLIALGHSVEMWMWGGTRSYSDAVAYLSFKVYDLEKGCYVEPEKVIRAEIMPTASPETLPLSVPASTQGTNAQRDAKQATSPRLRKKRRYQGTKSSASTQQAHIPPPKSLTLESQKRLYFAIAETLLVRQQCADRFSSAGDEALDAEFKSALGSTSTARLNSIGYEQPGRIEYWRKHLTAIGVFSSVPGADSESDEKFPTVGSVEPEAGAQRLFMLVMVAAKAAELAGSELDGSPVNLPAILSKLSDVEPSPEVAYVLDSLTKENRQRTTHVRYLVYCARALGLLKFEEVVPNSPDLIRNPHLTDLAKQIISDTGRQSA